MIRIKRITFIHVFLAILIFLGPLIATEPLQETTPKLFTNIFYHITIPLLYADAKKRRTYEHLQMLEYIKNYLCPIGDDALLSQHAQQGFCYDSFIAPTPKDRIKLKPSHLQTGAHSALFFLPFIGMLSP
ncbi:MAG: hypothetical protein G01um101466_715 [Parcubacteria group bacterium Gr01-1014_66]|nr:MAG: hypothetical protein G01um101466_715 [Parcubacteria group bacterium Gr01-1014_66]